MGESEEVLTSDVTEEEDSCLFEPEKNCPVKKFLAEKQVEMTKMLQVFQKRSSETPEDVMGRVLDDYLSKAGAIYTQTLLADFCVACMLNRLVTMFEEEE